MASNDDERSSTLPTSTDDAPTSTTGFDALPNDVIVSIFEKLLAEPEFVLSPDERRRRRLNNLRWVRETFPFVCRRWRDLYWSRNASPLHETLEVDFTSERRDAVPRRFVRGERVIAWARRHARDVRALCVIGNGESYWDRVPPPRDFTTENLATLVEILAPSLTAIEVGGNVGLIRDGPFWDALREQVAPRGQLRNLSVDGFAASLAEGDALVRRDVDVSFLGQLTSLEELRLFPYFSDGLRVFPASVLSLTGLRRLCLREQGIESLPPGISTLRGLEDLDLTLCGLSSLPEELGALTGLTRLNVGRNSGFGRPARDEHGNVVFPNADVVFPNALRGLKSLRYLELSSCELRAVPAFVGELQALEHLDLHYNALEDPWAPFAKPSPLTYLDLSHCSQASVPAAVLSSMPRLKVLDLHYNSVMSLPDNLGQRWPDLREIHVSFADRWNVTPPLRALRALAGASSLEKIIFDPGGSAFKVEEPLDFLLEIFPRLREMRMRRPFYGEWTPASRARLERFAERLKERDPTAVVEFEERF